MQFGHSDDPYRLHEVIAEVVNPLAGFTRPTTFERAAAQLTPRAVLLNRIDTRGRIAVKPPSADDKVQGA
ncbi:hypothetical protein ACWEIJ_20300 [Lentzea sp. NPDC004789]